MDTQTQRKLGTNIYITALDSTVNVNSLFMLAVFIGLTWNPTDPRLSLVEDLNCLPSAAAAEDLISFQVYSFGCFLFSSIVSLSLKQSLKIAKNTDAYNSMMARVNRSMLRVGILCVSVGSVCGCGFLMLALINLVQFKLGKLSCSRPSSHWTTLSSLEDSVEMVSGRGIPEVERALTFLPPHYILFPFLNHEKVCDDKDDYCYQHFHCQAYGRLFIHPRIIERKHSSKKKNGSSNEVHLPCFACNSKHCWT